MKGIDERRTELDGEAIVSIDEMTFRMILASPRVHTVGLLNDLIRKGQLIIWNPVPAEFVKEGEIIAATVINGKTLKLTLSEKKKIDIEKWCES